jgi:hypothetical protein
LQRIGKGRFTDIIAELTAGYSCGNINKWDEITGNFNAVLDAKVFINMNEAKDNDEGKRADFNVLKSIVTEEVLTINEKNVPRVESENVVNFCPWTDAGYKNQTNFRLSMEEKCIYKKKQIDGRELWRMILKPEFYPLFDGLVEPKDDDELGISVEDSA